MDIIDFAYQILEMERELIALRMENKALLAYKERRVAGDARQLDDTARVPSEILSVLVQNGMKGL